MNYFDKCDNFPASFTDEGKQWHHAYPFCKTTPGTGRKFIAQDCMQVLQIFVSETCENWSQEYLVS